MEDEEWIRLLANDPDSPLAAKELVKRFGHEMPVNFGTAKSKDGPYTDKRSESLAPDLKKSSRSTRSTAYVDGREYIGAVFEKLIASAKSFRNYGSPGAAKKWLQMVIRNEIVDQYRKENLKLTVVQRHRIDPDSEVEKEITRVNRLMFLDDDGLQKAENTLKYTDPDHGYASRHEAIQDQLHKAIRKMAIKHPKNANVVYLRLQDVPYTEIAQLVGSTPQATRQTQLQSTRMLIDYIEDCRDLLNESSNDSFYVSNSTRLNN